MDLESDQRITALEMALAHQGKTIEEMSALIAQQWTVIDEMRRKLDALTSRFLALEESAAPAIEVTRPPHW